MQGCFGKPLKFLYIGHIVFSPFLQMWRVLCKSRRLWGTFKISCTEGVLYTHTYTCTHIFVFFPTEIEVLYKAPESPVQRGLCEALMDFAEPIGLWGPSYTHTSCLWIFQSFSYRYGGYMTFLCRSGHFMQFLSKSGLLLCPYSTLDRDSQASFFCAYLDISCNSMQGASQCP